MKPFNINEFLTSEPLKDKVFRLHWGNMGYEWMVPVKEKDGIRSALLTPSKCLTSFGSSKDEWTFLNHLNTSLTSPSCGLKEVVVMTVDVAQTQMEEWHNHRPDEMVHANPFVSPWSILAPGESLFLTPEAPETILDLKTPYALPEGKVLVWTSPHGSEYFRYRISKSTTRDDYFTLVNCHNGNREFHPALPWGDLLAYIERQGYILEIRDEQQHLDIPVQEHQFYREGRVMTLLESQSEVAHIAGQLRAKSGFMLNTYLLGKQKRNLGHQRALIRVHDILLGVKQELVKYVRETPETDTGMIDSYLERIETLDTQLQQIWGFPEDVDKRIHWRQISGCTCLDNYEGPRVYSRDCPYHKHMSKPLSVDKTTMLISGFTDQEYDLYLEGAKTLILRGQFTDPIRALYDHWAKECGFDDRQKLLMMSTAFPQRLLLSLLEA